MSPSDTDLATAFHEAGHGVVAVHFGVSIARASIMPSRGRLGYVSWYIPRGGIEAAAHVQILLAGPLAESIFEHGHGNVDLRPNWAAGRASDFVEAARLADEELGWECPDELLNAAADRVHRLLSRAHIWDAVGSVARALCCDVQVPGWHVEDLCRSHRVGRLAAA